MIAPADLAERLPNLIDELRETGYPIGIEQYVAAQDILLALAGTGALSDDPSRYRSLLGPIFCTSAQEQDDFRTRFDRWIARGMMPPRRNANEWLSSELNKVERGARVWRWALAAGSIAALILVGFFLSWPRLSNSPAAPADTKTAMVAPALNETQSETAANPPVGPSPSVAGRVEPIEVVGPAAGNVKPMPVEIVGSSDPVSSQAEMGTPDASEQPSPGPVPQRGSGRRAVLLTTLSLLMAGALGWKLWWVYRARLFLSQQTTSEHPDLARVSVKGAGGELFRDFGLARMAQRLRHRRPVASGRIDVRATVRSTVRNAGWLTPVTGSSLLIPEYLVLVDRTSHHDHQAQFFDELIDRLEHDGVIIDRYEFNNDPRICHRAEAVADVETIRSLAARHPEHRLLIISKGAGLINPLTGEAAAWVDQFSRWPERFLLTPEAIDHWDDRELVLARQGFLVLPATEDGLLVVAEPGCPEEAEPARPSRFSAPFPELLLERPRRWLEQHAPAQDLLDEMLRELRAYLDKDGYEWLAACAVYPALHWELTLHLGYSLTTAQGRRLLEPKRLASLARLPWFRHGSMPDWLRSALIRSLPRDQERAIRAVLQALLLTASEGEAGDLVLEIARRRRNILAPLAKQVFRSLRRRAADDSPMRDYVFASYMLGRRPSHLALELPRALARAFRNLGRQSVMLRPSLILPPRVRAVMQAAFGAIGRALWDFPKARAQESLKVVRRLIKARPEAPSKRWVPLGAVSLAAALLTVFLVDKSGLVHPVVPDDPGLTDGPEPTKTKPIWRLAVTPGKYDDVSKLLQSLGEGYEYETIEAAKLIDSAENSRFDAIFLTCTTLGRTDLTTRVSQVARAMRDYVFRGGTLYASDLQFDTLKAAFPDKIDPTADALGLKQSVRAKVVDDELRDVLSVGEVPLKFKQDGWRPAAFGGPDVKVYLRAAIKTTAGVTNEEAPLLVRFPYGKGAVLFTSFHHEDDNQEIVTEMLHYLVLSTVMAGVESRANKEMVRGGFSPKARRLLSATEGRPSVKAKYQHARVGTLKFLLAFEDRGGLLKLEVVSPTGERQYVQGESTLTIEVPDAAAGPWECIATAEKLPYPKFPFALSVGEPEDAAPAPVPATRLAAGKVEFKVVMTGAGARSRSGPPRLGVTALKYDDMGKLLDKLGEGFRYKPVSDDDLTTPSSLENIDILFLTCGLAPKEWFRSTSGIAGPREGTSTGTLRTDIAEKIGQTLRRFVTRGGTLYASDFRYGLVAIAFADRRPRIGPNLAVLPELDAAELEWIRATAPAANVGTVADTLRKAGLGKAVQDNFNLYVAFLESSSLFDGGFSGAGDNNTVRMVREELQGINPPADETDVAAIARTIEDWEKRIQNAIKRRSTKNVQKTRADSEHWFRRVRGLRSQIFSAGTGRAPQTVIAEIVDPGLRDVLGESSIPLNFTSSGWIPARFSGDDVTAFMRGEFTQTYGEKVNAPLLVKFPVGLGTVIFTSFHNEAQNTGLEEKLLRYLVFAAVNAREESAVDQVMLSGGFSPAKRSVESHSSGDATVTRKYLSTKPGRLRFALTFAGDGARLRLKLVAPNGEEWSQETDKTLVVEAAGADAGEWLYTVTALKVPFESFPFGVSVGEVSAAPTAR
jgi:hypothetical protein